jgi:hypothetical protein
MPHTPEHPLTGLIGEHLTKESAALKVANWQTKTASRELFHPGEASQFTDIVSPPRLPALTRETP